MMVDSIRVVNSWEGTPVGAKVLQQWPLGRNNTHAERYQVIEVTKPGRGYSIFWESNPVTDVTKGRELQDAFEQLELKRVTHIAGNDLAASLFDLQFYFKTRLDSSDSICIPLRTDHPVIKTSHFDLYDVDNVLDVPYGEVVVMFEENVLTDFKGWQIKERNYGGAVENFSTVWTGYNVGYGNWNSAEVLREVYLAAKQFNATHIHTRNNSRVLHAFAFVYEWDKELRELTSKTISKNEGAEKKAPAEEVGAPSLRLGSIVGPWYYNMNPPCDFVGRIIGYRRVEEIGDFWKVQWQSDSDHPQAGEIDWYRTKEIEDTGTRDDFEFNLSDNIEEHPFLPHQSGWKHLKAQDFRPEVMRYACVIENTLRHPPTFDMARRGLNVINTGEVGDFINGLAAGWAALYEQMTRKYEDTNWKDVMLYSAVVGTNAMKVWTEAWLNSMDERKKYDD